MFDQHEQQHKATILVRQPPTDQIHPFWNDMFYSQKRAPCELSHAFVHSQGNEELPSDKTQVKHMSFWRRLLGWNRCAHNRLPLLKHRSVVVIVLHNCIIVLHLYMFGMKFTCKWRFPPSLVRIVTCNDDIISMFPPLLVLPFKNQNKPHLPTWSSITLPKHFWEQRWCQDSLTNYS